MESRGFVKLVGKPQPVKDEDVFSPTATHQKAIEQSRASCQSSRCPLTPYSVHNLESETLAIGAFCINGCERLPKVVASLQVHSITA